VEFHGQAVAEMSMASRFVLPNMMAEMGAKNAWVMQDEVTFDWLAATGRTQGYVANKNCRETPGWVSTSRNLPQTRTQPIWQNTVLPPTRLSRRLPAPTR
jgi:homoaconitase/3-isopropylmalate dehydratase large subunit